MKTTKKKNFTDIPTFVCTQGFFLRNSKVFCIWFWELMGLRALSCYHLVASPLPLPTLCKCLGTELWSDCCLVSIQVLHFFFTINLFILLVLNVASVLILALNQTLMLIWTPFTSPQRLYNVFSLHIKLIYDLEGFFTTTVIYRLIDYRVWNVKHWSSQWRTVISEP